MLYHEKGTDVDILTVAQSYQADKDAALAGVASLDLMEAAGAAIAAAVQARWDPRPVMVLAGPGNNGGDGFVVARLLKQAKWPVTVYLMGEKADLSGDAAANARRWRNKVQHLDAAIERLIGDREKGAELLVIDALFGAGLSKPLGGAAKTLAELCTIYKSDARTGDALAVVAVDVPSGLDGDTGHALKEQAFHADLTVTFCRPKPGHVLLPGRALCGERLVADIGIPDSVVSGLAARTFINEPELWTNAFPYGQPQDNKYTRGHLVVLGGEVMCGAARFAALAARRAGAGLVTIAASGDSFNIYATATEPGTLVAPCSDLKAFKKLIKDERKNACVLGPGAGVKKATRAKVLSALKAHKACVLDADALTVFQNDPKALFKACKGKDDVVLTPHGGEFARLFPDLANKQSKLGKLAVTRQAAKRAGCTVLYKGGDTVVATPDGRAAVTVNAPPSLATAGAGDVLAGFIGALLAQGMPGFEAANAAAWLHAECANAFGPGLIAEDLSDELPEVLDWLYDLLD
ncbi:NAD(P)H-hydrate dehydratase [Pseudomonadota bacterium]